MGNTVVTHEQNYGGRESVIYDEICEKYPDDYFENKNRQFHHVRTSSAFSVSNELLQVTPESPSYISNVFEE